MSIENEICFIVASNNEEVLKNTLLVSPLFKIRKYEIIVLKGYQSASIAYNEGVMRTKKELLIFVHQDVFFPDNWIKKLKVKLDILKNKDNNWGVIGCFGINKYGKYSGHVYSNGLRKILIGNSNGVNNIESLDEMVLIIKRSSGLSFDNNMPNFHLYGTDICLSAKSKKKIIIQLTIFVYIIACR